GAAPRPVWGTLSRTGLRRIMPQARSFPLARPERRGVWPENDARDRRFSCHVPARPATAAAEPARRTRPAGGVSSQGGNRKPLPGKPPMNDPTSPAKDMVTLFAADAAANGTASAGQRLAHLTGRLGLGPAQVSAVHAVMTWAVFLRPSTEAPER